MQCCISLLTIIATVPHAPDDLTYDYLLNLVTYIPRCTLHIILVFTFHKGVTFKPTSMHNRFWKELDGLFGSQKDAPDVTHRLHSSAERPSPGDTDSLDVVHSEVRTQLPQLLSKKKVKFGA